MINLYVMTLGHTWLTHGGMVPVVQLSPQTTQGDQGDQALSRLNGLSSLIIKYSRSLRRLKVKQVKHLDLVVFKWEATKYIIGVDFYIVASRSISLTDSFNTIVYLLPKQNLDHSVQSLRERCSLRDRQCTFRILSTKAGTIPPRNTI